MPATFPCTISCYSDTISVLTSELMLDSWTSCLASYSENKNLIIYFDTWLSYCPVVKEAASLCGIYRLAKITSIKLPADEKMFYASETLVMT